MTNDSGFLTSIPEENIVTVNVNNGVLNLTTDTYQYANIVDDTIITLPVMNRYKVLHLYFTTGNNAPNFVMPSGKYQVAPNLQPNTTYEFIFTYVNNYVGWLVGYVAYKYKVVNE